MNMKNAYQTRDFKSIKFYSHLSCIQRCQICCNLQSINVNDRKKMTTIFDDILIVSISRKKIVSENSQAEQYYKIKYEPLVW